MDEIDRIRDERTKILQDGNQKCENYNAIEDLMAVNASQAEKGTVFEKHVNEFRQIYAPLESLDKQKAEVMNTITQNMGPFTQLVSASNTDQSKQQFYSQLD